jgi:hypothetical protein
MIAAILPFIQGALMLAQLAQTVQGPPQPPPPPELPPTLGWDEAMRRATETLSPIYDERMQQTLAGVDKDLISRGFFGQLPGAALAGSRAADVERAKAAAIASLGGQMQSQSEEQAFAQQRLAAEWAMNQSNLWNQAQQQRQAGLGGLLSTALNYPLQHYQTTWEWPWDTWGGGQQAAQGANLTPKATYALGQMGTQYFNPAETVPISTQAANVFGNPLRLNQYTNPWSY